MSIQSARREKRLQAAEVAIGNALSRQDMLKVFEKYSYTRTKIEAGNTLLKAAREAHHKQQNEYGEQTAATATFDQAWDAAHKKYMHQIKVARLAFKRNEGALAILGLNEARSQNYSVWSSQVGRFYSSLASHPDLAEQLATFGVTAEELAEAQRAVDAASAADKAQTQEQGDAQRATVACDAAMDALDEWMGDFVEMARIAFEDDEQRLEYLGITARS